MAFEPKLRLPRERLLFATGLVFSAAVWAAVIVSIFGLGIVLLVLIVHALFLAHIRGNGVRVSDRQLSDLHDRVRRAAEKLGLAQAPQVYVIQAGGVLNAFATKLLSRNYVIFYSELIDQCRDPRQVDFIVGHEVGHLAAGHLRWNMFLAPFLLVPWLGPAYSRAREYTADRCGLAVAGDLDQSMRGLVVLAAGGKIAIEANLAAFMAQLKETGGFWMAVQELSASHPYLCKRVAALEKLSKPDAIAAVGRNPLAWLLAPVLGAFSVGSASAPLMLAIIGILAAIAVPKLQKYQRTRQALLHSENPVAAATAMFGGESTGSALNAEDRASLEWVKQVRRQIAERAKGASVARRTPSDRVP